MGGDSSVEEAESDTDDVEDADGDNDEVVSLGDTDNYMNILISDLRLAPTRQEGHFFKKDSHIFFCF